MGYFRQLSKPNFEHITRRLLSGESIHALRGGLGTGRYQKSNAMKFVSDLPGAIGDTTTKLMGFEFHRNRDGKITVAETRGHGRVPVPPSDGHERS